MQINDLTGKKVCIVGFGREGQAMLRALEQHASSADITIADSNQKLETSNQQTITGPDYLNNLSQFDTIIVSPGIPPCEELEAVKDKVTNSTQIFLDSIADSGAQVIGVTGTKGKSTTASILYVILKNAGEEVALVGNIGNPAMDFIAEAHPGMTFIMEMSSYQLRYTKTSPPIAVITSFFPEHLDYHGSLDEYKEAKTSIARNQTESGIIFYNAQYDETKEISEASPGTKIPYTEEDCPLELSQTHLSGEHNAFNIAAASRVAEHLGIPKETIIEAVKNFRGLPHRLESLGTHHGIEWVDDSISTAPETAIAALDALSDRVATIILGGQDRGFDFTQLGRKIEESSVETVILFPDSGTKIKEAIEATGAKLSLHETRSMEEAVKIARSHTPKGRICLLSPASPSYGLFKDFEERGDEFKRYVFLS